MILVTGGLGFIGVHTVRALCDAGADCIAAQRRTGPIPEFLRPEVGRRVFVEPLDMTDRSALLELGRRRRITGIVHLAGPGLGVLPPVDHLRASLSGLLHVAEAAALWGAARVTVASSIGVYAGVGDHDRPLGEDRPLPMVAGQPIEAAKKASEVLGTYLTRATGVQVVHARLSAIWGPLGRRVSRFFSIPQLVHAAVSGVPIDPPVHADDGIDLCYVRDCAAALAALQLAPTLRHSTYNVGSGRVTSNREVAAAIRAAVPRAEVPLADGRAAGSPAPRLCLNIHRLCTDTGFTPAWDLDRAVADYVAWLAAGHER